ncbi:MAG TPA: peroxiredoxin [Polyangiaceae bacterium]|nr:peroxiredoxin [Polyangiaceae bacterium]
MLKAGDKAPNFSLETDTGKTITLGELGDKPVVLFFYPKDDTPGCTIECKEFRDALPKFEAKAHVLGVSSDDKASHIAFREKFGLNFPLLVDAEGNVAKEFGVWAETPYGPQNKRTTFILRGNTVDRVFESVKPQGHADEVLKALG